METVKVVYIYNYEFKIMFQSYEMIRSFHGNLNPLINIIYKVVIINYI